MSLKALWRWEKIAGASPFMRDVAALSMSRVGVMVVSIISGVLVARVLGPEGKGLVVALLVVPSLLLSLGDLGLRQATTYLMGKRLYSDQELIATITALCLLISILGAGVLMVLYGLSGYVATYGLALTGIVLLIVPLKLIVTYGHGILLAKQRIKALAGAALLYELVYLGLIAGLLMVGRLGVGGVITMEVLTAGCVAVYMLHLVRQYGSWRPRYVAGLPQRMIKLGVVYAAALFILSLNYRFDIILLERLSNPAEVGIYSVGVGVAQMLWLVPSAISTVNFGHSANAQDHLTYARKTVRLLRLSLWIAIVPCLVLFVMAPWLIPFVYGSEYMESGAVVQGILPGVWIILVSKILNSDLAGRGRPQTALWVFGLALVINIVLNLLWIPVYGALGSAWASSVSYSIGGLIFGWAYARISGVRLRELFLIEQADLAGIFGKSAR